MAAHNGLVGGSIPVAPTTQSLKSLVLDLARKAPLRGAIPAQDVPRGGLRGARWAEIWAQSLAEKILVLAPRAESGRRDDRQGICQGENSNDADATNHTNSTRNRDTTATGWPIGGFATNMAIHTPRSQ
jgi:hypothetical protein